MARNLHKRFKVRLDAYLCDYNSKKELGGINSNGRVIRSGLRIKYIAKTNVGGEYEVCWQVVNTGKHAEIENGLRGEFFKARYWDGDPSNNPLMNWEYSKYTGKHWIECFIVKNNECIARSGKFFVNIKNPDFQ